MACFLMPVAGVEPARYRYQRILSFLIHSELSSLSRNLTVSFADKNLLKTAETPRKPGFLG